MKQNRLISWMVTLIIIPAFNLGTITATVVMFKNIKEPFATTTKQKSNVEPLFAK